MIDRKQNGFTLVELAIALMVIGLLIGGVLKGQELIENARITAAIRQINAYETAGMMFRSSYNAMPGDIRNPGSRIPDCTSVCAEGGDGNGRIPNNVTLPEMYNYYPHLTKAGMISGHAGIDSYPITTMEEWEQVAPMVLEALTLVFYTSSHGHAGNWYFGMMPYTAKRAAAFDRKLDDGMPRTGRMRTSSAGTCIDTGTLTYLETAGGTSCLTLILLEYEDGS